MTDPIDPIRLDPIRPDVDARRSNRRAGERRAPPASAQATNLPAVISAPELDVAETERAAAAAYAAQLIGQEGAKRGLRGGPQTLEQARSAYLGAEWSGPSDRRPAKGRITKTEI